MRIAVVTGTSSGIGAAIATRLLGCGWRVVGLDRAQSTIANPAFSSVAVDLRDKSARLKALRGIEPSTLWFMQQV